MFYPRINGTIQIIILILGSLQTLCLLNKTNNSRSMTIWKHIVLFPIITLYKRFWSQWWHCFLHRDFCVVKKGLLGTRLLGTRLSHKWVSGIIFCDNIMRFERSAGHVASAKHRLGRNNNSPNFCVLTVQCLILYYITKIVNDKAEPKYAGLND